MWTLSGSGRQRLFAPTPPGPDWRNATDLAVELVGEQFAKPACLAFSDGEGCEVELEAEPDNPHDSNAIRIIGIWTDRSGARRREPLGYLPRHLAAALKDRRPDGMPLRAAPYRAFRRGDFVDLKIRLFEPSAKSAYWRDLGLEAPKHKL